MKSTAERTRRVNLNRSVAERTARRAAPASLPRMLEDNSAQAEVQSRLQKMADNSPRTKIAAQLQAMIDNSPRMVVQRQQLERKFGKPVQRLEAPEEEKLLQGKFVPVQKDKKSTEEELPMAAAVPGQALPAISYAMGGVKPGFGEDEFVGARTVGEVIGDVVRPVGAAVGNIVGSITGALTGINISTATRMGPTWGNHGQFNWQAAFATTGANGWIVQEIVNTYRAQNGGIPARPTPHYWEAWAVDTNGNVTPGPDDWIRPSQGPGSDGHWSMTGSVHFTTTNPATVGFAVGNVIDAGILPSTTAAPGGLGIARLKRYAQGTWDSTGTVPVHTGSAGPT